MNTQTPTRDRTVLLTPADAAALAKVSVDTIYREVDRGVLPVLHVGYAITKKRNATGGVTALLALDLFEISLVPAPANP